MSTSMISDNMVDEVDRLIVKVDSIIGGDNDVDEVYLFNMFTKLTTTFTKWGYPVELYKTPRAELVANIKSTWLTIKQVRDIREELSTPLSEGAL